MVPKVKQFPIRTAAADVDDGDVDVVATDVEVVANVAVTTAGTPATTDYTYAVIAIRADGSATLSATDAITTGPAALGNTDYCKVNFDLLSGAILYRVYRLVGGVTQGLIASQVSNTEVLDKALVASGAVTDVTYGYQVVAVASEDGAEAAASAEVTVVVGTLALSDSNLNTISWVAIPGASNYKVYRSTGGDTQGLIGSTADTSFDDTGLAGDDATANATNATGVGYKLEVADLENKTIQVGGTFSASLQMQGSTDGLGWADEGTAITTASVVAVTPAYKYMRVVMSDYVSGSPTVHVGGQIF